MFSLTIILGVFAPLYIAHSIWAWHRLSHIPGPFCAAFSKLWVIRESFLGRQPTTLRDVTNKYGSLARVGPNELVTSDPEVLRKIMSVRSAYSRGPWYDAWKLEAGTHNLFSMRDEVAHTRLRKKMSAGYSGKENESMERTIETNVARFVELIRSKYVSTARSYNPADLAEKLQYFTLDVISDLAFGQPLGYLQQDADPYDNIPAGLKEVGATKANAFGLYLNDFRGQDGSITFGGVDTAKFQGDLKAAPLVLDNDGRLPSFVVDFSSMTLSAGNTTAQGRQRRQNNMNAVDLSPRDGLEVALIDSGAPSVDVPVASMRSLAQALGTTFNEDDGSLGNVPCSMGQQGMSVIFGFNQDNAKIQVPLELMMLPDPNAAAGQACGGVDCFLPFFATDGLATLGAPFMQAAYIVFDMDQQRLLMAQAVLNATESNVQEFTAFMAGGNN